MRVKLSIPSLKDIKLSQYEKFKKLTKDSEDNSFINNQLIACFCNFPIDKVRSIAQKDYDEILEYLIEVLSEKPTLQTRIIHDGVRLGFIPNLEDITVGEQADLENMIDDWGNMQRTMSILYRPIKSESKGKYLIEDYTAKEKPLDLPLSVVFGARVFFYDLLKDCLRYIKKSMEDQQVQTKMLPILAQNGVGIKTFTHSLQEIFSSLNKSLSLDYMKH